MEENVFYNVERQNGCELIDTMEFNQHNGETLGFISTKEIDKEIYTTWRKTESGYDQKQSGFTSRESAFLNLVERASKERGLNLKGIYEDYYRTNEIQNILSSSHRSLEDVDFIMNNKEFCYRTMNQIDQHDFSGINEELLYEVESVIHDMVQEGRLFTKDFCDALDKKEVFIEMRDGDCLQGKINIVRKEYFMITQSDKETPYLGKLKDVRSISQDCNVMYYRGEPQFILTVCVEQGDNFSERKTMGIDENRLSSDIYRNIVCECLEELGIHPNSPIHLESEIIDNRDFHSRHDEITLEYKEVIKMFYEDFDSYSGHESK